MASGSKSVSTPIQYSLSLALVVDVYQKLRNAIPGFELAVNAKLV